MSGKMCEMTGCGEPATRYAGYAGASSWAGYVCTAHALDMLASGGWSEDLKKPVQAEKTSK